jgi:hypothetical protein
MSDGFIGRRGRKSKVLLLPLAVEDPALCLGLEGLQHLRRGPAQDGMAPARRNLHYRSKHERPVRNAGMGQHGGRGVADNAVEIQDVEVERTRTPSLGMPAPRLPFYGLEVVQKRFGRFTSGDPSYSIEKVGLVSFSVWRRSHKSGCTYQTAAGRIETANGTAKDAARWPPGPVQIASESDEYHATWDL